MQNLRDKLLKAGLVSEDQAKKAAEAAPPRRAPEARRDGDRPPRRDDDRPARREGERPPRRDERPPRREAGGRPPARKPAAPASAAIPKLPPLPGSKAAQRLVTQQQVKLDRELRELVLGAQVPVDVGATVFYFQTRKGKLRRLELTEAQAKLLEDGALAVVERPDPGQIEHALVPAEVAEKMYALSQRAVRFLNRKDSPIGFMDDAQLAAKQASEAAAESAGEAESPEAEHAEAQEAEHAEAQEAEASEADTAPEAAAASDVKPGEG